MNQATRSTSDHGLRCQPMSVAFSEGGLTLMPGFPARLTGATVVHAAGRDDAGTSRSIQIRAPFSAVVPTKATLATIADSDPSGWVIALNLGVLGQVSQQAFCEVPKWSTFLGSLPTRDGRYIECFAERGAHRRRLRRRFCRCHLGPHRSALRALCWRGRAGSATYASNADSHSSLRSCAHSRNYSGRATCSAGAHEHLELRTRFQNGDR